MRRKQQKKTVLPFLKQMFCAPKKPVKAKWWTDKKDAIKIAL
jgi:hypothetical protein